MNILSNKLVQLHIIILLWGFTPVIGKYISLQAIDLVWYRLLIASISLFIYIRYKGININLKRKEFGVILLMGVIVGFHWFFFYHAIKVSNVAIALSGFSTMTIFASLIQPFILKQKFFWPDLLYGVLILIGLIVILKFEKFYADGLLYGILAAFTGAIFGVFNGRLIKEHEASTITLFEFIGAFILLSAMKLISTEETFFIPVSSQDLIALLVLSILCTTVAFTWSIHILKYFSPFTVIITNNLEPIYGIIFSLLLFGATEVMSFEFYVGTGIILLSVFTYPLVKQKFSKQEPVAFIEQP
jgi:drug/metabolite transporter (DMT)-like permease